MGTLENEFEKQKQALSGQGQSAAYPDATQPSEPLRVLRPNNSSPPPDAFDEVPPVDAETQFFQPEIVSSIPAPPPPTMVDAMRNAINQTLQSEANAYWERADVEELPQPVQPEPPMPTVHSEDVITAYKADIEARLSRIAKEDNVLALPTTMPPVLSYEVPYTGMNPTAPLASSLPPMTSQEESRPSEQVLHFPTQSRREEAHATNESAFDETQVIQPSMHPGFYPPSDFEGDNPVDYREPGYRPDESVSVPPVALYSDEPGYGYASAADDVYAQDRMRGTSRPTQDGRDFSHINAREPFPPPGIGFGGSQPPPPPPGRTILQALRATFATLRREMVLITGIALFFLMWSAFYAFVLYKPAYSSSSKVIIRSPMASNFLLQGNVSSDIFAAATGANPLYNMLGMLKSAMVRDALWDTMSKKHPQHLKKLSINSKDEWNAYYGDGDRFVNHKNEPATDIVNISFTWNDPLMAKEALDIVLKTFADATMDINQAEQKHKSAYLSKQIQEISKRLLQIRDSKSQSKSRMMTANLQKQSEELQRTKTEYETRLDDARSRMEGRQSELNKYASMLGMSPEQALEATALGMNPTLTRLQDTYYNLSQQYAQQRTGLTDKHPRVKELQGQMEQVESQIATEVRRTVGRSFSAGAAGGGSVTDALRAVSDTNRSQVVSAMVVAQADMLNLKNQVGVMESRIRELNSQLTNFPKYETEIVNIEQEEKSLSDALDILRQQWLEAKLKQAAVISNVVILDPPFVPVSAAFPQIPHILLMGLGLGLLVGTALAFAKAGLFGVWTSVFSPPEERAFRAAEAAKRDPGLQFR